MRDQGAFAVEAGALRLASGGGRPLPTSTCSPSNTAPVRWAARAPPRIGTFSAYDIDFLLRILPPDRRGMRILHSQGRLMDCDSVRRRSS
jgi:hypothetical protein